VEWVKSFGIARVVCGIASASRARARNAPSLSSWGRELATFTNKTFKGHYPVGAAAVVDAPDAAEAACRLSVALAEHGLPQKIKADDMIPFGKEGESVCILCDGNY
jgi:hypothetical protein